MVWFRCPRVSEQPSPAISRKPLGIAGLFSFLGGEKMIPASLTEPIAINDVSGLLPGRPSAQAVHRWHAKGLIGPDGNRVRLRTIKIGGRRFVEPSDLRHFMAALQSTSDTVASTDRAADGDDSARRAEAADQALQHLGF